MKPTRNDSDYGLGNALFDDHVESNPMDDEPTETHHFEATFFELIKKNP